MDIEKVEIILNQSNLAGTELWNPKPIQYRKRQTKQSTLKIDSDLSTIKERLLKNVAKKSPCKKALVIPPVSHGQNKKQGRKHIGIPCDIAQDIEDLELRLKHIGGCSLCQKMYKDLEEKVQPR